MDQTGTTVSLYESAPFTDSARGGPPLAPPKSNPIRTMKALPLCALLLLVPTTSSCIVLAAGAGAAASYGYISHQNNTTSRDFNASPAKVWKAVLYGMKAQNYTVEGAPQLGPVEGVAIARDTRVTVERVPGGTSRVRIRVGTFESEKNERLGRLLMHEIARRLGEV